MKITKFIDLKDLEVYKPAFDSGVPCLWGADILSVEESLKMI